MKYIFFIINNFNKILSEYYIKENNIQDYTYIYLRKDLNKKIHGLDFYNLKGIDDTSLIKFTYTLLRFKITTYRDINKILIDLTKNENFIVCAPHTYNDTIKVFITNNKCKGLIIIEEGDASYSESINIDPHEKNKKMNNLRRLYSKIIGLNHITSEIRFFPPEEKVISAIGASPDSYKFYQTKKKFYNIKDVVNNAKDIIAEGLPNTLILIDDLILTKAISEREYINSLSLFLKRYKKSYKLKNLAISFHPNIRGNREYINKICEVLKNEDINYTKFNGHIECYLNQDNKRVLIGLQSSSLRYAKLLGNKAFNWINFIENNSHEIFNEIRIQTKKNGLDIISFPEVKTLP